MLLREGTLAAQDTKTLNGCPLDRVPDSWIPSSIEGVVYWGESVCYALDGPSQIRRSAMLNTSNPLNSSSIFLPSVRMASSNAGQSLSGI
eukprot:6471950-Amphidinium_carterae.1